MVLGWGSTRRGERGHARSPHEVVCWQRSNFTPKNHEAETHDGVFDMSGKSWCPYVPPLRGRRIRGGMMVFITGRQSPEMIDSSTLLPGVFEAIPEFEEHERSGLAAVTFTQEKICPMKDTHTTAELRSSVKNLDPSSILYKDSKCLRAKMARAATTDNPDDIGTEAHPARQQVKEEQPNVISRALEWISTGRNAHQANIPFNQVINSAVRWKGGVSFSILRITETGRLYNDKHNSMVQQRRLDLGQTQTAEMVGSFLVCLKDLASFAWPWDSDNDKPDMDWMFAREEDRLLQELDTQQECTRDCKEFDSVSATRVSPPCPWARDKCKTSGSVKHAARHGVHGSQCLHIPRRNIRKACGGECIGREVPLWLSIPFLSKRTRKAASPASTGALRHQDRFYAAAQHPVLLAGHNPEVLQDNRGRGEESHDA